MHKKWLILVFSLAFILRVTNLTTLPIGFTPDEASFGYDAYSLLKTGKDQWGRSFPLVLESFGDFKPPLYAYLTIPFVALFGLTEFAVRLPNALAGTGAVIVTYYLVKELTLSSLFSKVKTISDEKVAFVASVFLAFSPWHIMMSRGAFEANLTTFFIPLGLWGFYKTVNGEHKFIIISALAFGISLFSYHSAKLVTPLLLACISILYSNELREIGRKYLVLLFSIFGLFLVLTIYTFTIGAGTRASDVSVLSGAMEAASGPRLEAINSGTNPLLAKIFYNQYVVASKRFATHYIQYFSPKFLIIDGPAEATYGMIPGVGVLYLFDIFFVFYCVVEIAKKKSWRTRELITVLSWMLLSPIPAALTTGAGYAGNRSVIMLPALSILFALGSVQIYVLIKKLLQGKYLLKVGGIIYIISAIMFIKTYYQNQPIEGAEAMLYGRREMIEYLIQKGYDPRIDKVVIDKRLSEPQMHVAFYMNLDPQDFQEWTRNWTGYKDTSAKFVDQLDEYNMGTFLFTTNFLEKRERLANYIQIGKPEEFDKDVDPAYVIKYPDGGDAIYIVEPSAKAYALKTVSSEQ